MIDLRMCWCQLNTEGGLLPSVHSADSMANSQKEKSFMMPLDGLKKIDRRISRFWLL